MATILLMTNRLLIKFHSKCNSNHHFQDMPFAVHMVVGCWLQRGRDLIRGNLSPSVSESCTLSFRLQEIDGFVQEFLSVVFRLPSCIATLQTLSRQAVPASVQELKDFCSANEARFQQLQR